MNMINNLILEGVVSVGVSYSGCFSVESERHTKVGEEMTTTTVTVWCQIGDNMKNTKSLLTVGRGVRIVGRLQYISVPFDWEQVLGIFVEHIEYKLFPKVHKEGKYNFTED